MQGRFAELLEGAPCLPDEQSPNVLQRSRWESESLPPGRRLAVMAPWTVHLPSRSRTPAQRSQPAAAPSPRPISRPQGGHHRRPRLRVDHRSGALESRVLAQPPRLLDLPHGLSRARGVTEVRCAGPTRRPFTRRSGRDRRVTDDHLHEPAHGRRPARQRGPSDDHVQEHPGRGSRPGALDGDGGPHHPWRRAAGVLDTPTSARPSTLSAARSAPASGRSGNRPARLGRDLERGHGHGRPYLGERVQIRSPSWPLARTDHDDHASGHPGPGRGT